MASAHDLEKHKVRKALLQKNTDIGKWRREACRRGNRGTVKSCFLKALEGVEMGKGDKNPRK